MRRVGEAHVEGRPSIRILHPTSYILQAHVEGRPSIRTKVVLPGKHLVQKATYRPHVAQLTGAAAATTVPNKASVIGVATLAVRGLAIYGVRGLSHEEHLGRFEIVISAHEEHLGRLDAFRATRARRALASPSYAHLYM